MRYESESRPPQEVGEKLDATEKIKGRMEDILREARSEKEAEEKIRSALAGHGFDFLGPMIIWESGSTGALIDQFRRLGGDQKRELAGRMLEMLKDGGPKAEKVLSEAPSDNGSAVEMVDASENMETRSAIVLITFPDEPSVNVEAFVRINPSDN